MNELNLRKETKMKNLYCEGYFIIVLTGLLLVTSALICEDNRGAGPLISGDNSNAVNNFVRILTETNTFEFEGDSERHEGCRRNMGRYLHKKGRYDTNDDTTWVLDCWEPTECTLVEEQGRNGNRNILRLVSRAFFPSLSRLTMPRANTVLLPIDAINTISYTFLPFGSQRSALFVTSLLSGCSVFIATSNNVNCNIIVMHANRYCRRAEPEDDDDNHKQAMYVLDQVHSTNQQCRYQIHRRWASDYKRANVERHNYHYSGNIVYYRITRVNFVYGYNLGGDGRKWQFCIKELDNSPRPEICNEINLTV